MSPVGLAEPGAYTSGDPSSVVFEGAEEGRWALVAREPLVVVGISLVERILAAYGTGASWASRVEDGMRVESGAVLGVVRGIPGAVLPSERVILNFLQMLSGIATLTAAFVAELGDSPTRLLDTRKTPPGYRYLAKWAFACGGGYNHRFGLWDRVMLKDNHLATGAGAEGEALVAKVREAKRRFPNLPVEVEVDRIGQIEPAIEGGADIILFDNFQDRDLVEAVGICNRRCLTEASGGIGRERLRTLGGIGLNFISTGAPIHQARWVDIGMDAEGVF